MFLLKLLYCLFVVYGSEIIFAFAKRRCFDCVSIRSCESGFEFARKLHQGTLPYEGRQTFNNAICDYEPGKLRIPKVCCSDFDKNMTTTTEKHVDTIEHHQNIGLLPTLCGDFHIPRLISSNVAELYEFPWMTFIAYNTSAGIEFGCAGSVINSRYILTAAHCVIRDGHLKKIAAVRVGELDYNTDVDCQGTLENMICESKIQDIDVEEIIPHENFTGKIPVEDDIALLRLKETINMTNNAAPICLPVNILLRNAHLSGKNAIVASWGIADEKAVSSSLMKTVIPILSDDACSQYYSSFGYQRALTAGKTFCAGSNMTDTCQCDSGGPLMMKTRINDSVRLIQLGIFSLGRRKCGSEFPDVYTDVTKYMDWILDNIRD